jgi:O-antigen/teichoic acid export membrane protein
MSLQIINASWMAGEKVFSMLVTFSVGVLIANYLGVEAFGTYSYALSLIMLLTVASHAGLNGLVVHELLKFDSEKNLIVKCSFLILLLIVRNLRLVSKS